MPRVEHPLAGEVAALQGDPTFERDLELLLQRTDRAGIRLTVVPEAALPRATHLWKTTGVSALPVVLSIDTDPTQCAPKQGQRHCNTADLAGRRADGREAAQAHLLPPQRETDPNKALLWALGLVVPVLPAAALLTHDASAMAPPATPPPAELEAAYARLVEEQTAAGLYADRHHGTQTLYGRIFRREAESPIAELVVDLYVGFGEGQLCRVELAADATSLTREVALDRRDVCRVSCPPQRAGWHGVACRPRTPR